MRSLLTSFCFILLSGLASAQDKPTDTIPPMQGFEEELMMDTSLDLDALFEDFDLFLDSILSPRSFLLASVSASNGLFHYPVGLAKIESRKELVFSPVIGYYHKAGPGISVSGNIINEEGKLNAYQFGLTGSYDFIRNRSWMAGMSFTHYITRDSLKFYTTPLQNEVNAYFTWRDSWLQPGLAAAYGWGSRSELQKRFRLIRLLRLRRLGALLSSTTKEESVADFSITASVRHQFYWLHVFHKKDFIRLTPLLSFTAGTQQYGLNRSTGVYGINSRTGASVLYNSGNVNLDQKMDFQPVSLTLSIRPEYTIGKFFIQPQCILDYYFPADTDNFSVFYSINAGFIF